MKRCRHCHSISADHLEHCGLCGGPDFQPIGDDLPFTDRTPEEVFRQVVERHVIDPVLRKLYFWQWDNAISLQQPGHTPSENRTDDSQGLQS